MSTSKDIEKKAIEDAVNRFTAQSVLFAPQVSRLALMELNLPTGTGQKMTANVWRNHAFEPLQPLVGPYFAYRGWRVNFHLGAYDDALLFSEKQKADIEIVWLDSDRFLARMPFAVWIEWLEERLRALRATTTAPILLVTWGRGDKEADSLQWLADRLPAVFFADLEAVCFATGAQLRDSRSSTLAGTPLSKTAQILAARELACHWLPGALLPPVKAIVLDLDHTLHAGVLAEEGIEWVQLTPAHTDLQHYLKLLRDRGIFLALASRNERSDVEALFAQRQDYPLRWEDFSAVEVSWDDKAAAVERIAKTLRIAPDAVLFVDDNPGELASVGMRLPQVHTVHARADAHLTQQAIHFYPGLWRWKIESEDAKRIQDAKANTERESLAASVTDPLEYFQSLQISLAYFYNPKEQLSRLADLCNKTNQFNLALRRFNLAELANRMEREDACVASVQLTDRLADSGVIAVIVAERSGTQLRVEELCISCRALGRHLEDTIILWTLRNMPIADDCCELVFRIRQGPRNQPALDWLAGRLGLDAMPVPGLHALPIGNMQDFVPAAGVTLNG